MSDSYARIRTDEAQRLAGRTVEVIDLDRKRYLNKKVLKEANRHNWWTFLPWVKTWNLEQARYSLGKKGLYWCHFHWSAHTRATAILNLVKAAGSDPWIYITAEDYQYIQHGVDHDRLSGK